MPLTAHNVPCARCGRPESHYRWEGRPFLGWEYACQDCHGIWSGLLRDLTDRIGRLPGESEAFRVLAELHRALGDGPAPVPSGLTERGSEVYRELVEEFGRQEGGQEGLDGAMASYLEGRAVILRAVGLDPRENVPDIVDRRQDFWALDDGDEIGGTLLISQSAHDILAWLECPSDRCSRCTGEYCDLHSSEPCDCDVLERHQDPMVEPPEELELLQHLAGDDIVLARALLTGDDGVEIQMAVLLDARAKVVL